MRLTVNNRGNALVARATTGAATTGAAESRAARVTVAGIVKRCSAIARIAHIHTINTATGTTVWASTVMG
ncbi:MAG: hypothetical protein OES09_17725 [Gammaproteobacteria bacterium]|nr:hypothetical protein [Gammaproteobacteria bacterium]